MKNETGSENKSNSRPLYMSIGLSIGVAIGAAMDNIPIGMCIGLAIGLCIGTILDIRNIKKAEKDSQEEKKEAD